MDNAVPLPSGRLLKPAEVRELVDISRNTLDRWLLKKIFPPPLYLTCRVRRWRAADIERFLAAKTSPSGSAATRNDGVTCTFVRAGRYEP